MSQVGYLSKQDPKDLDGLVPFLIDRRVNLRYERFFSTTTGVPANMS